MKNCVVAALPTQTMSFPQNRRSSSTPVSKVMSLSIHSTCVNPSFTALNASLSLALGMSDVIQAYQGGIQVETLFVDEGFGSLDEETLQAACDTLYQLTQGDKLVGIISHVESLKQRIDNRIEICKTNMGSTLNVVTQI